MGDRHWLAVHTKRTLMSEQCSDDVRGGRKKRAHVLEDNEELPGVRADPALSVASLQIFQAA
jgi:hypothetical protein